VRILVATKFYELLIIAVSHRDRIHRALNQDTHDGPPEERVSPADEPARLPLTHTESLVFKELIPRYGHSPFDLAEAAAIGEAAGKLAIIKPALDALRDAYYGYLEAAKEASHCRQAAARQFMRLNATVVECERWLPAINRRRSAKAKANGRKPRSRTLVSERCPTPAETEALYAYGECKGNVAAAARRLGKDRSTVAEQIKKGLAKVGKTSKREYLKSIGKLPADRRGQVDIGRLDPEIDLD
jgi:hypothetical protein